MTQTSNPERVVPTRRLELEPSFAQVPRHFAKDGDLIMSHLTAALSGVFPDGENFFVRSVRQFRDQVTDPVLTKQVAGFIGQEARHGREHRAFNDRLDELGYPTKRVEAFTRRGLAIRQRVMSPVANLAATAALEHFTATLAELVMTDAEVRDSFGDDAVRDLFVWHALEESEHKAVAFDVYKAVGGSERTRVWTMKVLRVAFVLGTMTQMALSLLGDAKTYRRGVLRASVAKGVATLRARRYLWAQLKDYDRADFHPDDRDTTALVTQWREELFGEHGRLNDRLAKAAA